MKYGVIVESLNGGDGMALHWAETKEAAEKWLIDHKKATPQAGERRFTIVEVVWSIIG